ncbi:DHH family phosphoesterase [Konateibacter massiliensis]|uniref:DHH family phosphoesterase n=1 Tax=Konateibacter massiliensis TaxID=2002841 RepID=UPI000C152E6F|nr:DHH family phosphoesterase [Konateibacter massiliensis]
MTRFEQLLSHISKNHVFIQTHNFPDPDAIASAYGLQKLLEAKHISSTICYNGRIDRLSTLHMIEKLGITLYQMEEIPHMTEEDEIILVDSQKGNINVEDMVGNIIICIDHHPSNHVSDYKYADIRKEIGACASIVGEYFVENNIPVDKKTATALIYGIKIDTANLSRGVSQVDLDLFYYLYTKCDMDIVQGLEHSVLQIDDLHAYANAINNIDIVEGISFADTGMDCPEALIANISDFMMSIANVYLSVVYARKTEGLKLSVRSKYSTCDAGELCKLALEGLGNGGGHAHMAGGYVPFSGDDEEEKKLTDLIKERFLTCVKTCKKE